MKIVLDVKSNDKLKENDLIVCVNGQWSVVSRESFLTPYVNRQREKNFEFEREIEKLQKDLVALAKIVKEK